MSVVEPEKIAMNGMDCAEIDKAESDDDQTERKQFAAEEKQGSERLMRH